MKWSSPQCVSAFMMLVSGIILSYVAFFMSADKDIPEGALWYFGQTLIYAGGIFGIKGYVDGKIVNFKRENKKREADETCGTD